jgi:hypothetical protein
VKIREIRGKDSESKLTESEALRYNDLPVWESQKRKSRFWRGNFEITNFGGLPFQDAAQPTCPTEQLFSK